MDQIRSIDVIPYRDGRLIELARVELADGRRARCLEDECGIQRWYIDGQRVAGQLVLTLERAFDRAVRRNKRRKTPPTG